MTRILVITVLYCPFLFGQNFNDLDKKKIVHVSGSINTSAKFTTNINELNFQNPFTWCVSGQVNVSFLDLQLPFRFSYSNLGTQFTQPTSISSFEPKYKWFQGYFGQTSMNFSKNTISGTPFLGGGIELTFKKVTFKCMAGRTNKAIEANSSEGTTNQYKRIVAAVSTKFQIKKQSIEILLFKGIDLKNSLVHLPLNSEITPKDNFIPEAKMNFIIGKKITLNLNYALSILTNNINIINIEDNVATNNFLFYGNLSTSFNHFIQADLNLSFKNTILSLNYNRIDPNFISLGNFYTNNDLENISIQARLSLFKNKWKIDGKIGVQRNGIKKSSFKTSNLRLALSFKSSVIPYKKGLLSISYNNFTSSSIGKDPTNPDFNPQFDTLRIYSANQNATLTWNTRFGSKSKSQAIIWISTFQEITSFQGNLENNIQLSKPISSDVKPNKILNNSINYSLRSSERNFGFQLGVNHLAQIENQTHFIGPTLSFSKNTKNKQLSFNLASTYNYNYSPLLNSHVLNQRLGLSYKPQFKNEKAGKINLNLTANWSLKIGAMVPRHRVSIFLRVGYSI